jgi:4-hydroxy-tetrahydrodipicolinate synthase
VQNIGQGLSAFPLTPLHHDEIDERSFVGLIKRLVAAGVDSITALGSTGSYVYLSPNERARVAQLAVANAGETPVIVGVGDLRTSRVLTHVDEAEAAGAAGVLLAPVSYQPLTHDDVYELFRTVTEHTALPVIVYDNPGTTHFSFTPELYASITKLPGITSLKIPAVPANMTQARDHVRAIREIIPDHVTIGVSGDASAATGLSAGCDAWYSVIGGVLPSEALALTRAAQSGQADVAAVESKRFAPLFRLFGELGGSFRVTAAIAEHLGLAAADSLPLPVQGLTSAQRIRVAAAVDAFNSQ